MATPSTTKTTTIQSYSIRTAITSRLGVERYPYNHRMPRNEYERLKRKLQIELLKMQTYGKRTEARQVIVFEGRDPAGKGGTIKRFMEHLNPRSARVVALEEAD